MENIAPHEAVNLIYENRNNPKFELIDVRTPEEYSKEHLEGAINCDVKAQSFSDELDKLSKEKTYLVYCGTGKRGLKALDIMDDLGFTDVYNLEGGIERWKREGMFTEK